MSSRPRPSGPSSCTGSIWGARRLYLVLGDNGAGKSTLLRAIAGLMRPSRGAVTVLGSPDLRSVAAEIGYMAHGPLLYDEMVGLENLRYFARLYGIRGGQRCDQVMRAVGLDPDLPRRVGPVKPKEWKKGSTPTKPSSRWRLKICSSCSMFEPMLNNFAGMAPNPVPVPFVHGMLTMGPSNHEPFNNVCLFSMM